MKFLRFLIIFLIAGSIFTSCEKDFSVELGNSTGSLKSDSTGECRPILVQGNYIKDTALKITNYVDVQIQFTRSGSYFIKTDTINGYSFSGGGSIVNEGISTVRLLGSGKPVAVGTDVFTVNYYGSTCVFSVAVSLTGGPTSAIYTLGGSPGSCTGAVVSGTYTQGTPTTSSNKADINVNVTTPGTYSITTGPVNGVTFTGTGNLAAGAQTVTLFATGTPTTAGPVTYPIAAGSSNCTFSVTVAPPLPPAVYTIDCTGATVAGTYQAGTATTAANKVTISATSTGPGSFSITTPPVNGVSFSGSGSFPGPGGSTQPAVLFASGTPTAAGAFSYTATAATGGSTCTFMITYTAAAPPATYTINCTGATIAGTYQAGTPTTSSNKVTISATSTSPGSYNVTTNTMNGVSFSGSGSFPGAATQPAVLFATGTPSAAGTFTYTATASTGGSTCMFSVTFTAAAAPGIFNAKLNGVQTDFSINADGTYPRPNDLIMDGDGTPTPVNFNINIDKSLSGSPVTMGTYVNTPAGQTGGGYILTVIYKDPSGNTWKPADASTPTPDPFQINITGITATRVIGTFSGTLRNNAGTGTNTIPVTQGVFDLPIN